MKRSAKHKGQLARIVFTLFSVMVVAISAMTSFSFFYHYFAGLLPDTLLEFSIRAIISGVVGVLLFDVACVIWLLTFLHHSETSEQRAISLGMTLMTFVGAAAASVAYLSLTATGDLELAESTKGTIAIMALIVVILGVVLNFGAAQAHQRYSLESKAAVREADRRDALQDAEDNQATLLDQLVAKSMQEKLTAIAPELADEQAGKLAGQFLGREQAKYHQDRSAGRASTQGVTFHDINPNTEAMRQAQVFQVDPQKRS
jgi:hypothetical protein